MGIRAPSGEGIASRPVAGVSGPVRKVAQAKTLAPQIVDRHDLRSDQRMRRQNPEGHTDALPTEFGKAAVNDDERAVGAPPLASATLSIAMNVGLGLVGGTS